jgi:hypothetical protein
MNAGSDALYRRPWWRMVLLLAAPVLVLAAVWVGVTQLLLKPAVPGATAPPDQVVQFIVHPAGLPRLDRRRAEAFLEQQVRRLVRDAAFRGRFLAEYRVASPEEQQAFRAHLFDAFKPRVMDDIRAYSASEPDRRAAFLDDRIIAYNRLNAFLGPVHINRTDLGPGAPSPQEVLDLLMQKTTEQERQMGLAYALALKSRVEEILADPTLKADFEARLAAPPP